MACNSNAQNGYPKLKRTKARLFYIQHSNNHNTYVYDANLKNGVIDKKKPIKEYRVVYSDHKKIKPLSSIQRRFAYGMILLDSDEDTFSLRLAASKKLIFKLKVINSRYHDLYITINGRKLFLDRVFVKLKR